ncbi:anaphase-promoting complex subunit 15B [Chelonus insularis]|uniref:anaphase-promoting complex subunit 15B n=1 Tax=Chelonus insularis TaxID=460826 RepID=UPI00158985B2|nr:anaphase-promoting complex subunit 15B-like [Chelonus insularis]
MAFRPLWPNLQPRATDPLWFNADKPCDDEEEVEKLEAQSQIWKDRYRTISSDQIPIGKSASDFRGSEEEDDEEEEEEGEEEEESDTHEEEEEEFDEIDMEVSYTQQQQRSSPTDTPTDPVSIRMVTHTPRYP